MSRTYFTRDIARAIAVAVALQEVALELGIGTSANVVIGGITTAGLLLYTATTPAGEPDSAAWPNGLYEHQIDVVAMDSTSVYGALTLGLGTGAFARLNAAATMSLETQVQAEGSFSTPGLKLVTYTGAWTAGTDTDLFAMAIAAQKVSGHGVDSITTQWNETDDFARGPWAAGNLNALATAGISTFSAEDATAVLVDAAGTLDAGDAPIADLQAGDAPIAPTDYGLAQITTTDTGTADQ